MVSHEEYPLSFMSHLKMHVLNTCKHCCPCHRSIKGGVPVIRSAPPHYVTKEQADRLVTVASKILVANVSNGIIFFFLFFP